MTSKPSLNKLRQQVRNEEKFCGDKPPKNLSIMTAKQIAEWQKAEGISPDRMKKRGGKKAA